MSENPNSDVETSTTIEGSSPELLNTFQNGDTREEISKAYNNSEDKEKSGETGIFGTSENLKKKGDPEAVDSSKDICTIVETEQVSTFQDLEKKESKTVAATSENIENEDETEGNSSCQAREKIGETEVFSTSQNLEITDPKVVDSSQDIKKLEETGDDSTIENSKKKEPKVVDPHEDINTKVETKEVSTCQSQEKIRETEVVSTSLDLENKGEPEAIFTSQEIEKISESMPTLEASEDSFSEGSIHIRVSEPFSLTEDLELYLSEDNSDDGTEKVDCLSEPPLQHQNGVWSKQEVINGKVNPTIPQVSGQRTPVGEAGHTDKSEKLSIKPSPMIFTNMESDDNSPSNPDQVADPEKHVYSDKPKRRGRPPKSVKKNYPEGSDDSSNKKVKQRSLKGIEQPINVNVGEITKTEIMSISSFDKTVLREGKKKENLVAEEPTSSTGCAFKRNTNILSPKDLINQTLAKLMSGNLPRSQKKSLGEVEKGVISDKLQVSSIDKSGTLDISEQRISDDSNINMNSRPKRGFKSIKRLGELSTKCHTTEIKGLPSRELTDEGSKNKNNSEQTNKCISLNSSPNEDCKKQLNLEKSSNKCHSVTMITPRELINRTLEKLTCKKIPPAKQKPSVKEENPKINNLSSEQIIEKRKEEEMQRELINRTLAKLTNGALPKSKQEKSDEKIITNDSSAGPFITNNEEEKISKKKPATVRALIPRKSKLRAKMLIPLKLMENCKRRKGTISSLSDCKNQELKKAVSIHEDNFETKNRTALLQNESCNKNIPEVQPSSNICSTLKIETLTDSNLKNEKTSRPKTTSNAKDEFCRISDVVSPNKKNNEKASQKSFVKRKTICIKNQDKIFLESPVLHDVKCVQMSEKTNKSCPTLNSVTEEPEVIRGKHPKSKQLNSKEKVIRKKTRFASNIMGKKQLQKTVLGNKYKYKSNKELPLNKKFKGNLQIDRRKSLSSKMTVVNKESISMTETNFKINEIIPEDRQEKCSSPSEIPSSDQVKYKEQIKTNPIVCLVDCKKIGLCASNEDVVSKFKFQTKKDPAPKQVTCIPNHTDNHMNVNSGEYFTQLELSPASKSPGHSNRLLTSLPTSANKTKSTVDKASQINEIIVIDDDDDDDDYYLSELCSSSVSLPPHKLEGSKQCSVVSSQKSVSVENFATKKSPGDHIPNIVDCNSVPSEQFSSVKVINRAFSLSTQVQKDNINYASQLQSSSITHLQSVLETHNYVTKNSVRKDNNLISAKLKEDTRDLSQNNRSITSPLSSNIMKHSSSKNIVKGPAPHNTLAKRGVLPLMPDEIGPAPHNTLMKKCIPPLMSAEMQTSSSRNKEIPSNSCRTRGDRLKLAQNIPISAPLLLNKNIPVTSGSKNYYFTPLFVLDGEKFVPLNASNASNYSVGTNNTENSQLKSGDKYCEPSTVTKMKHSQIIIDSKTIKPLPTLDLVFSGSSVVSPSVASPKLDHQSFCVINPKTQGSSGSFKVSSTKPNSSNLEPITKRKRAGSDGAGTRNELDQDVVHCSSSTYSIIESNHLTAPKRLKYQSSPVTQCIYADHGSTKKSELSTKRKIYSGREKISNECEHHEEAFVPSSIECDKPTPPKRQTYQEHHKTNHIPMQPSEKFPVSGINRREPDPNKLNYTKDFNKQLKGKGGDLCILSGISNKTKENVSVSRPKSDENKPSGSPKQDDKKVNEKNSQQNKNKQVKSKLEETVYEQSDSLKNENKQVNSSKMDDRRKVKMMRIKSKEEDLEECLDGVPPFIKEVFECENIRDGFDNKDLIFVLSLLPDIEEMTSAQRVIFQSRAIQIINSVFANTKLSQSSKSVKT